ncbi:hypothetical protein IJF81_04660 [bacterium]|nr:hypothetical protein [bacterium]
MAELKHYTESIYYEILQTAKFCKTLGVQVFDKFNLGISIEEYSALDTILINDNICQRDLAKLILKDRANTGRLLDSLDKKKLIKRHVDLKNNRLVRRIKITEKGKKVLQDITIKVSPLYEKCVEKINQSQIETLRTLMKTMRNQLSEVVEIQI